jgi:triacylglycerol esterase/lipase EstA (alpha/beta hydrolase family)
VAAAVAGAATLSLALRDGAGRTREVPVLVVPGYNGTPASVAPLARRIRRDGRRVEALALPGRGRGDIVASARVLAEAVAATGAGSVDLVGFSAGGVVVRAYLDELDQPGRVRRVVLLGAPNHGAEVAGVAAGLDPSLCTGACAQLTPGSSLLAELNAGDETPYPAAYTNVWTELDSVVTPATSARLEGADNVSVQRVCPGASVDHGDLVTDPLSLGLVVEALRGDLARAAAPSCAATRALGREGITHAQAVTSGHVDGVSSACASMRGHACAGA